MIAPEQPPQAPVFEAGRRGEGVRSDLLVRFTPQTAGGLVIELARSKVAAYYGKAIRAQAESVLLALDVRHGKLVIEDEGALPFTIAARIEAAVKRAGLARGRTAAPIPAPRAQVSAERLRRSRLYLPGNDPKLVINAKLYAADGLILDLEDSVHPNEKDAARVHVRHVLTTLDLGTAERMVRINQLPAGLADLEEIVPADPDLILIPKAESASDVQTVDARIREIAPRHGITRSIWLMPILESARGIENALEIAMASERVVALTIGLEDYTADLGVVKTKEGDETLWARQRLINAARAAGVAAIDSVYGDVGDLEGLLAWGRRARAQGFSGMGCVHPRQIAVIHEAFAPSPDEIARALRIVGAFEEAKAKGLGVVSLGSKMIDAPVVRRALALVERAKQMGLVAAGGAGEEESR